MTSKVAIVELDGNDAESLKQALHLIGGMDDLNTAERSVVVKVGVFSHRADNHTSVSIVNAIINSFNKAPKIFLAESDNYQGKGSERLQIWKELFNERVVPFNLSDDKNTRKVRIASQEMDLSHILSKPNVFVDTHILRSFKKGSILKNLFGCVPDPKKAKFHKNEIFCELLADIYEAIGGIDLAVLDGTYFFHGAGDARVRMNTLLVGRDAIAVETVGATLAGLNPEKMPVIQEFVKRGLGEGDLGKIEIVGASFESLKEKFGSAAKELEARWRASTRPPSISKTVDKATEDGWMNDFRKASEVVDELKRRGVSRATYSVVGTTLRRRLGKTLERIRVNGEWVYRKKKN